MTEQTKLPVIDGETLMDGHETEAVEILCRYSASAGHLDSRRRTQNRQVIR